MDTGSTRILMPKQDWLDFFAMVCSELPEDASCYTSDNYRVLRGDITDRELFKPVRIQIDNVIYFLPLEQFFTRFADGTYVLRLNQKDMIVFGIDFLNQFYQAYDIKRN